jgi:hypothetical protein
MAAAPPHIHTGSDGRFRVWDGDRFVAIYEPDDHASASAHLQRLEPKRRKRPAVETPRELVLQVTDVPAARRGAADAAAEDPEKVHLKEFSDGWRVWNPPTRSYVSGPDGAFASKFEAMARARELSLQAFTSGRGGASKATARRSAAVEGGGLFAAREMAAPGQQVGFKFNGRAAGAPVPVAMFHHEGLTSAVARAPGGGFLVSLVDTEDRRFISQNRRYDDLVEAVNKAARGVFGNGVSVVTEPGWGYKINGAANAPAPYRSAKPNHRLQGRRGTMPPDAMPHYADAMPIGRAMTADDAPAPARRRSVEEYDRMSSLRPNGAAARPRRRPAKARAGR